MPSERGYWIEADIEGGDVLWVTIEAEMIKEFSDSESLGMKFATMAMSAKVDIIDVPGLRFGMRAYSGSRFNEDFRSPDGLAATWSCKGPMLPWNSVVLWWRIAEDDGDMLGLGSAQGASPDHSPPSRTPARARRKAQPKAPDSATLPSE